MQKRSRNAGLSPMRPRRPELPQAARRRRSLTHTPRAWRLARTVHRGLPGVEDGADEGDLAWIQFDSLIRTPTPGFRRILPAGWTISGRARGDIQLRVPDSRSESTSRSAQA